MQPATRFEIDRGQVSRCSTTRAKQFKVPPKINLLNLPLTAGRRVMTESQGISRRQALTIAAIGAGASIAGATAVIGTSTPAHAAKAAQKLVKYQDTPKGEQRCETCLQFEAPSSCKAVDGAVTAQGWCMVYAKKEA
jgi:hypothetical protein